MFLWTIGSMCLWLAGRKEKVSGIGRNWFGGNCSHITRVFGRDNIHLCFGIYIRMADRESNGLVSERRINDNTCYDIGVVLDTAWSDD